MKHIHAVNVALAVINLSAAFLNIFNF